MIVDVIFVNNVMGTEGAGKGRNGAKQVKALKAKGWVSCYQTGDRGGWKFVTTSKKLAIQVSRDSLLFARGSNEKDCLNIV